MFWLLASGLVLLSLLFCWPVFFRPRKLSSASPQEQRPGQEAQPELVRGVGTSPLSALDREAYNTNLYKDFAAELAEDLTLDEASREGLLADKARQLLDDSNAAQAAAASARVVRSAAGGDVDGADRPPGWVAKVCVLALMIGGSALVYWNLGTPGADELAATREILRLPSLGEQAETPTADSDAEITRLRRLTGSLRAHVQRAPEEAGSWYLLGIGELKLSAYGPAADAFSAAHKLVGEDANLDLYWLQARLLADEGKLSADTQVIAARVLASQPNQPMVLNMLALAAFRSNDFAKAVGYLNSALSNNLTAGQRELLDTGFVQARSSLGVVGPTVDVELAMTGEPPADAVVFIIARPVGGGIPYAVVRRPVAGVPAEIRLDDAVSMNPANPLSGAAEIEIVARLSLTGRPQAGPGDWQWRSEPFRLSANKPPIRLSALLSRPADRS